MRSALGGKRLSEKSLQTNQNQKISPEDWRSFSTGGGCELGATARRGKKIKGRVGEGKRAWVRAARQGKKATEALLKDFAAGGEGTTRNSRS